LARILPKQSRFMASNLGQLRQLCVYSKGLVNLPG
jgi:hypothetical protein